MFTRARAHVKIHQVCLFILLCKRFRKLTVHFRSLSFGGMTTSVTARTGNFRKTGADGKGTQPPPDIWVTRGREEGNRAL